MNDIEKVKSIIEKISPEISDALSELKKIKKDGNIKDVLNRDDLSEFVQALATILNREKYFGLTEVERIIKASKEPPMKSSAKKYHGFDGCFE